jgi:hypothetical protein
MRIEDVAQVGHSAELARIARVSVELESMNGY